MRNWLEFEPDSYLDQEIECLPRAYGDFCYQIANKANESHIAFTPINEIIKFLQEQILKS